MVGGSPSQPRGGLPYHEGARRLRRALIKREVHVGRVEQQLDVAGRTKAALGLEGAGGRVVRLRVRERIVVLWFNKERRHDGKILIGFYQSSRSIHRNIGDSSILFPEVTMNLPHKLSIQYDSGC